MILDYVQPSVTPSMNEDLSKPFKAEEVVTAFRSICPEKAPSFDSPNVSASNQTQISDILHFREIHDPGVYLGVPLAVGINKTE
ncbi:hypothetical protein V6N12_050581 [Hibiscus sabdariffa]|uniref:Uncharacterized protein n=1 Tax=Hibiscus sabdariffa TaxID=183260 RepID=A0ABR2GD45_9ROSI